MIRKTKSDDQVATFSEILINFFFRHNKGFVAQICSEPCGNVATTRVILKLTLLCVYVSCAKKRYVAEQNLFVIPRTF